MCVTVDLMTCCTSPTFLGVIEYAKSLGRKQPLPWGRPTQYTNTDDAPGHTPCPSDRLGYASSDPCACRGWAPWIATLAGFEPNRCPKLQALIFAYLRLSSLITFSYLGLSSTSGLTKAYLCAYLRLIFALSSPYLRLVRLILDCRTDKSLSSSLSSQKQPSTGGLM